MSLKMGITPTSNSRLWRKERGSTSTVEYYSAPQGSDVLPTSGRTPDTCPVKEAGAACLHVDGMYGTGRSRDGSRPLAA